MSELQRQQLIVTTRSVKFPMSGWLTTKVTDPAPNGRVLVTVYGHSGCSKWTEVVLTVPASAWSECTLLDGTYRVEEAKDKKGQRLLRFFYDDRDTELILLSVPGFIIPEASEDKIVVLASAQGHSRTWRHGDRWSLVAAIEGSIIAYQGYYGDPIYARVTSEGIVTLGGSELVLSPSEW
jgi:hypothetical protein